MLYSTEDKLESINNSKTSLEDWPGIKNTSLLRPQWSQVSSLVLLYISIFQLDNATNPLQQTSSEPVATFVSRIYGILMFCFVFLISFPTRLNGKEGKKLIYKCV